MTRPIPPDWLDLLRLLPGYDPVATAGDAWFDVQAAELALAFFPECLTHVEGELAGKPFDLESWEKSILANLWGWQRKDAQGRIVRRYREALIYLPRKQGKTPLVAGVALLSYFTDDEPGAQCYVAAESREQAGKLFRHLKGMVSNEPELRARCRVYGGNAAAGQAKSIVKHDDPTSFIQVISADAQTQHGGNTHLAVIDELHTQPDRELIDVLTTSMAGQGRKQPLLLCVTTADFQRPSICNEKYEYACKVRDNGGDPGKSGYDPSFLPVIYEAMPDEDWTDEKVWARANPNLGVSVSLEYLRRECQRAKETPAYENTFRRLHLNQRTATDARWIPDALWMQGQNSKPFDLEMLRGKPAWAAIDFGWREDYAALVALIRLEEVYYARFWFWLPRDGGRKKHLMPTAEFISLELVTLTPGNTTDTDAIFATLEEVRSLYDLRDVAIDPSQARSDGQELMNQGYEVFEFTQSKTNYNEPCQMLVKLLKEEKLRHGGNKVARWMVGNCHIEENGLGQIMPKKKKSTEKIDGVCALTMCLARAILTSEPEVPTVTWI